MQQVHLQFSDQVYNWATRQAFEAGYETLDEFLVEVLEDELAKDAENIDHRFSPEVIAELDRVSASVRAGAQTYSQTEVDEHFRRKFQSSRVNHSG